jgi:hypothetical protein
LKSGKVEGLMGVIALFRKSVIVCTQRDDSNYILSIACSQLNIVNCRMPHTASRKRMSRLRGKLVKIIILFLHYRNLKTYEDNLSSGGTPQFHEDCAIYKGYH